MPIPEFKSPMLGENTSLPNGITISAASNMPLSQRTNSSFHNLRNNQEFSSGGLPTGEGNRTTMFFIKMFLESQIKMISETFLQTKNRLPGHFLLLPYVHSYNSPFNIDKMNSLPTLVAAVKYRANRFFLVLYSM